jgi:choline kinase
MSETIVRDAKCVILGAGRGRRLEPITKGRYPKCLLKLGEKTLFQYQVEAARAAGLNDILVVTGFKPDTVEKLASDLQVNTIWNPLSEFTENIASLAIVRNLKNDLVIINGDVFFPREFLPLLLSEKQSALLIDRWSGGRYDAEAMRVSMDRSGWITSISKTIPKKKASGEYIGICRIRNRDMRLLRLALTSLLSSKALWNWYESAFDLMMRNQRVFRGCFLPIGYNWAEIDTPQDYRKALNYL